MVMECKAGHYTPGCRWLWSVRLDITHPDVDGHGVRGGRESVVMFC